jgi:hypothetical protein
VTDEASQREYYDAILGEQQTAIDAISTAALLGHGQVGRTGTSSKKAELLGSTGYSQQHRFRRGQGISHRKRD